MKLEGAGGFYRKMPDKITEYGGALLTGTAQKEFEAGHLQEVGRILSERVNFVPRAVAETRPNFEENRGKLNSQPGLIIANHPGKLDAFVLLSMIEREDLLVMVDEPVYAALVRQLGPDVAKKQFVSNEPSLTNLKNVLRAVNEHIDGGGAFMVFPAGGGTEFQSTFGRILQNRKSTDMVYSFHLNPDDVHRAESNSLSLLASIGVQVAMPQSVPSPRQMTTASEIKIDERYSTVEEWQQVMKEAAAGEGKKTEKVNAALTEHFNDQFVSEDQKIERANIKDLLQWQQETEIAGKNYEVYDIPAANAVSETPVLFMTGRKNIPQTIAGNAMALSDAGFRSISINAPHGIDIEIDPLHPLSENHAIEFQRAAGFIAALDATGVDKADVVGNSEGGLSAILAAFHYPDRVRNLVLVNPAGMIGQDSFLKLGWRYLQHKRQERDLWKQHPAIAATFELGEHNKEREDAEASSIAAADVAHLLRELKAAGHGIVIVHTTDDLVFPSLRMNEQVSAQKVRGEDITKIVDGFYTLSGTHNEYLFNPQKMMHAAAHGLSAMEKKQRVQEDAGDIRENSIESTSVITYVSTNAENRNIWEGFGKRRYYHNPRNKPFIPDRPMSPFEEDYYERREREKRAGPLEKLFAPSTRQTVLDGKNNPDDYETFSMAKFEHTSDDVIWICFPGLGSAYEESEVKKMLGTQTIAERIKSAAVDFIGVPGVLDSIPQEGTAYVFRGPAGIAGYTPEQCIRSTEAVKVAVDHLIEQHPTAKIKFFSYSAGTHLGFHIANELGRKRGKPVDDFVAVAPGNSIGYGMYSTWVVEPLAQDLERRGITKQQYHDAIKPYTQIENLEYLPKNDRCKIFAGTDDSFIPIDMEGGTNDLVKAMDRAGLSPIYAVYEGKNHVSLLVDIIIQMQRGMDPYRLRDKINALENPGTLQNQAYMQMADRFLNYFTTDQLRDVGEIIANRNGGKGVGPYESDLVLKPYEKILSQLLRDRGILDFRRKENIDSNYEGEPVALTVLGERRGAPKNFLARRRQRQNAERNFAQIAVYLQELGRSGHLETLDAEIEAKVA